MLWEEIKRLEYAVYVCYEQGFNKALVEVKHFASGNLINLFRVDRERKVTKILVKEAPTDRDAQEVAANLIV